MSELQTITVRSSRQVPGFFTRLGRALRSYWTGPFSLKDPALNRLYGVGTRTIAGPVVNEFTMFMCAAVYDAVNQIASDVAKLPLNLMKRRENGGSDHYTEAKLYKLMKMSPNPETRSMVFRRTLLLHALTGKAGFAEIERDRVGRPAAIWNLEPHRVEPFFDELTPARDGRKEPLRYRVDGKTVFESGDILNIHGLGTDGVVGFEMVQVAREAIGLALASQQFAAAFFGNGTRFGGVLSSDQDLDPDQATQIRERIEELHAKADKAFRLLVLGAGFKFEAAGVKPNEAQMKEIRDQQVTEVARFYNMPLHRLKLNNPGAVSYASVEMADLDYYKGCLLNWITLCEQEFDAKLISPLEQGRQFFKHNAMAFLRGDTKSRTEFYNAMLDKGVFCADNVLDLEDMNPQPNGQGQLYLVQGAMVPKDQLVAKIEAEIEAAKQKAKPPPAPTDPTPDDRDRQLQEAEQRVSDLEAELGLLVAERDATQHALETAQGEIATVTARRAELAEASRLLEEAAGAKVAAAEQIAAEKGAESEEAHAARVAAEEARQMAETHAAASALEQTRLRTELDALTERAAELRERGAVQAAELAAKDEALAALRAERDAQAQAYQEAQAREAALEADRQRLAAESDAAKAQAEAARTELATAVERSTVLAAEAEAAKVAQADAQARVVALEAACATGEAAVVSAQQAADEARAQAESLAATVADLQRQIELLTETSQVSEAGLVALRDAQAALEQQRDAAQTTLAEREAALAEESVRRAAAETALIEAKQAEQARLTAVLGALRGQYQDALERITRREVQQARSKQATPEKVRRWLLSFPELHEAFCVDVLLPVVRLHVAWRQVAADPSEMTQAMAREHIAAFMARVEDVLKCDEQEFHVLLERALTRWETERPTQIADAWLVEAVNHVR